MADVNSTFAEALILHSASGSISPVSNVGAGTEAGEPDDNRGNSLWWVFEVTAATGPVVLTQAGSSGADLYILLYRMPFGSYTRFSQWASVASDDDSGGSSAGQISLASLTPGIYAVKWASFGGGSTASGVFAWSGLNTINATFEKPPPPPPTTYYPIYELYGEHRKVVTAQVRGEAAEGWARQQFVPVQRTPMLAWMIRETGFVWPGSTGVRWPTDRTDCL